jgi:hypothetical protein
MTPAVAMRTSVGVPGYPVSLWVPPEIGRELVHARLRPFASRPRDEPPPDPLVLMHPPQRHLTAGSIAEEGCVVFTFPPGFCAEPNPTACRTGTVVEDPHACVGSPSPSGVEADDDSPVPQKRLIRVEVHEERSPVVDEDSSPGRAYVRILLTARPLVDRDIVRIEPDVHVQDVRRLLHCCRRRSRQDERCRRDRSEDEATSSVGLLRHPCSPTLGVRLRPYAGTPRRAPCHEEGRRGPALLLGRVRYSFVNLRYAR